MPEPEDSMRRACDALLVGDIWTAMNDLTPEALSEAMSIGSGIAQIPSASGYTIESRSESGGEHRFDVRFETNVGPVMAHAVWRQFDGFWKVTSLGVDTPV
jgi:hypothetical protein